MVFVYYFGASWCPGCVVTKPIIEGLAEDFKEFCNFYFVDVDVESDLADKYGVRSLPVVIVENDNDFEVGRFMDGFSTDLPQFLKSLRPKNL
jgi:thiol-disulfide isomerase/thioredoxin